MYRGQIGMSSPLFYFTVVFLWAPWQKPKGKCQRGRGFHTGQCAFLTPCSNLRHQPEAPRTPLGIRTVDSEPTYTKHFFGHVLCEFVRRVGVSYDLKANSPQPTFGASSLENYIRFCSLCESCGPLRDWLGTARRFWDFRGSSGTALYG